MTRFVSAAATTWSFCASAICASPSCTGYGGASGSRGDCASMQFLFPVHVQHHVATEHGVHCRTGLGDQSLSSTTDRSGAPPLSHNSRSPSLTTYGNENVSWRLAYDVPSLEQVSPLVPENEGATPWPRPSTAWHGSCPLGTDMKSPPEISPVTATTAAPGYHAAAT